MRARWFGDPDWNFARIFFSMHLCAGEFSSNNGYNVEKNVRFNKTVRFTEEVRNAKDRRHTRDTEPERG